MDMFNSGVSGSVGIGDGMYGTGNQYLNAPAEAGKAYGSVLSPYAGNGSTQTNSGSTGANVIGGALAGAQFGQNLGFGGYGGYGSGYGYASNPSGNMSPADQNYYAGDSVAYAGGSPNFNEYY